MKPLFVIAGLVAWVSSTQAQTTNGVTTSAERQALYDANARAAQSRNNGSSSGSSSSSGSTYSAPQGATQAQSDAQLRSLFGIKTQAETDAIFRQNAQRERADREAREAATRLAAGKIRLAEEERQVADRNQQIFLSAANFATEEWMRAGFTRGDGRLMGCQTQTRSPGVLWGTPAALAALDRARAARQAFRALYDQPDASYEQLRQVARQLPIAAEGGYMGGTFGVGTALGQYEQLLRRFPAQRATAAADVLQASENYLSWPQAAANDSDQREFQLKVVRLLLKTAAAYPEQRPAIAARLGLAATQLFKRYYADDQRDSLVASPLLRFCYAGTRRCLLPGQAAATGLSEAQLQTNASALAQHLGQLLLANGQLLPACAWLVRSLDANPTNPKTTLLLTTLLADSPAALAAMPAAAMQRMGVALALPEPLQPDAMAWLADTVYVPDHPRWQALTAPQQTSLRQALVMGNYLWQAVLVNDYSLPKHRIKPLLLRLAAWNYVLSAGSGAGAKEAQELWELVAQGGSLPASRNLYREYLRFNSPRNTAKSGLYEERLHHLTSQLTNKGEGRYLIALLLLDELPGYPPLGKSDKNGGKHWLRLAAEAGSQPAAERLKR